MKNSPLLMALTQLQESQHRHDVAAHQDILYSLVPKKLTHFTLHFAKYQGAMSLAIRLGNPDALNRALVDSLIITLAAANALNLKLSDQVEKLLSEAKIDQSQGSKSETSHELLMEYVEIVGRMAKACEVLDHLENYPSRQVLERSVVELTLLLDRFARHEKTDIVANIAERWLRVEQKAIFGKTGSSEVQASSLSLVGKT